MLVHRYGTVESIAAVSGRISEQAKECLTRAGVQAIHALVNKEAADKVSVALLGLWCR